MVALYVFSLIVGGSFLALAMFGDIFGGHADVDMDTDLAGFDGDLSLDAGHVDLDMDMGHVDLDVDAGDLDVDVAHADVDADASHVASKIFSIRTLIYSLFGFGAVGTALTYLTSSNPLVTAGLAVLTGLASGAFVNTLFGYVKGSESGALLSEQTYEGLQGRISLPMRQGVPGTVVLERGGRRLTLRALPHASGEGDPTTWTSVFVVEMEKGVARVAPIDEEMLLGP